MKTARLPIPVISVINDVKNDIQFVMEKMNSLMDRVADTRQIDRAGVYELFDEIQQKMAFRLADYYASGNMEEARKSPTQEIHFPEANTKPS